MPHGGKLGRLKFRTAEKARGAAADLGLSKVHSHMMGGERIWMPGASGMALNRRLRDMGKPPAEMPGMMMDEMDMAMRDTADADLAAMDGMGMGSEMSMAARDTIDVDLAGLDGAMAGAASAADTRDADLAILDGMGMGGEMDVDTEAIDGAIEDGFGVDADELESVAPDMMRGTFVGDEDGDGEMELY